MKKITFFILLLCITLFGFSQQATTFILVRHAEKADDGTRNPPLNESGKERANDLASLLANQEVTALYSTPFKRTEETLQPLAKAKEIEIMTYDPYAKGDWLNTVMKQHTGGTVVISGHSNTIPGLANALLGVEIFQQFDEGDYANLIVIVTEEVGKGKMVRLKF